MRNVPVAGQAHCRDSRQPVVAVYCVIAKSLAATKFIDITGKGGSVLIQVVLVNGRGGSSFDVNNPYAGAKLHNLWRLFIGASRIDINLDMLLRKFLG